MFDLTKNTYMSNGKCWYKDEYDNTAFIRRIDDGFVAKLRFSDESVTVEPLTVKIPLKEDSDGAFLKTNVETEEIDSRIDLSVGIRNFTQLIQRWINMSYEISGFSVLGMMKESKSEKEMGDLYSQKLAGLSEYDELKPAIDGLS